ncbi:MAG: 16S rRNA (adenine(1518)-N(6)/adenine(1519)-N(6))-dimethyltransferase RsmA [Flavobacteriia bacterium]|nr:16S rRNA (adenine(1518)-N(6)/adenine(1519)-N(6))-dimethyltransferase RsmA [Flavobacteriia bacterium]OJX38573.1 MAG: 16S rRNA (adenine(1518)-N(6)/adenine(1519)-N(6))-dimethyltransferase [Flavobacteriia bacterium 40-80]
MQVKAKKHLGQHFLTDKNISRKIAQQYGSHFDCKKVLEIGPGMGAMTQYLLEDESLDVYVMEIDRESVAYLNEYFPKLHGKIIDGDFLKYNLKTLFGDTPFAVVGNFPYNISSQILFRCIEFRDQIPEIMGMFQKEVAERIAEKEGSKMYGIISVLLQTFYDIKYCFTVDEHVFNPPPKVKSGVIRLTRNERKKLPCDEQLYIRIVKACFNQRRKMIRNTIKPFIGDKSFESEYLTKRPEQLSVEDFIRLTLEIEKATI